MNFVCKVGLLTPPFPLPKFILKSNDTKLRKASSKFYHAIKGKIPQKPSLVFVIWFRVFRVLAPLLKDRAGEADYLYWRDKGWLAKDCKYYCEVKISIAKRLFAWGGEKAAALFVKSLSR